MPTNELVSKGYRIILAGLLFLSISNSSPGQATRDTLPSKVTLSQCIAYALAHQALVKQSMLNEDITKRNIRIALSGWYPQLEFDAGLQDYLQAPIAYYPNVLNPSSPIPYQSTSNYVSPAIFSASQTLYSTSLLFAARTSRQLKNQASENTENTKINTYVDVTKAFFDVLLTEQELNVLDEDIVRLQRNYKDAYSLYQTGLTDKIDYQRTEIALSNAQAQRRTAGNR